MKFLLLLHYPGYMRYFDVVVRDLLERGHSVHIAFENPEKQAEGLEALRVQNPRLIVDQNRFPRRSDRWTKFARALRGTIDYVRYLDPRYKNSPYLRNRTVKALPSGLRFIAWSPALPSRFVRLLRRCLVGIEVMIPSAKVVELYLSKVHPDALLVSPLVNVRSWQTDAVKSAKSLGIPTGLCVGSWDHLTTKGLIRIKPDRVFVWNAIQKREAFELHDVPLEKVVVTGAQPFDKWFERRPTMTREQFCGRVGLPDARPYILFVGSTASISSPEDEVAFVRRWISELRKSDCRLRDKAILVRPHPFNCGHWTNVELKPDPYVTVFPRAGANPVNEDDRADYFHSLYHSIAVVGINTSAMVEATILGKPVLTLADPTFDNTQQGTLHFQYLLPENGGFLDVGTSLAEHVRQLQHVVDEPSSRQQQLSDFVENFVRPCGRDKRCTDILVDAMEALAKTRFALANDRGTNLRIVERES